MKSPHEEEDWRTADPADDPGMPKAIAFMLAPMFLLGGLALQYWGNMRGGRILLILAGFALVSGLYLHVRGPRPRNGPPGGGTSVDRPGGWPDGQDGGDGGGGH